MKKEAIDTNSLAYTKWNCKYHTNIGDGRKHWGRA